MDDIISKLERNYFNNMKDNSLYYLSYYCYLNGDYYKSYLYSDKYEFHNLNLVYNILSLLRLGYKNLAFQKFEQNIDVLVKLYEETNYFYLDVNTIKMHILQLFIVFENDRLLNEISKLDSDEKIIYKYLMENDYSRLSNTLVNYNDQYIKEVILHNIKSKITGVAKPKCTDINALEKYDIDIDKAENRYCSYNYKNEDIEVISYKHPEHMVSMHVLRYKDECVIVDCGAYIDNSSQLKKIDVDDFFEKNDINKSDIKGVFITHAHVDHYGSLDRLKDFEIYMSKNTYELIELISPSLNINLDEFDITLINLQKTYKAGSFKINAIKNGHILGSCAYLFNIEKINNNILFTGDFCLNNQNIIDGMNLDELDNIDYLVMETTYGHKKLSFTYEDRIKLLIETIGASLENDVPVLIPSFSIGRSQELLKIISQNFPYKRILVDGSAACICGIYNKHHPELLNDNIEYKREDLTTQEKIDSFDIIISSSGMLQNGTKSKEYLDFIKRGTKAFTIIKSGFINPNSESYEELKYFDGVHYNYFDIGISAHATYNQLLFTIDKINPKKVVMVHGDGINFDDK